MEQKKTLLVVSALVLLLAVAYPLYNHLSRDAQPDQLVTLPQKEDTKETQPTQSMGTNPTQSSETQPVETKPAETQPITSPETQPTQPSNPPVTLEYDFVVTDGNGKSVKLSDYVGKPIVLNFWASWCGPCKNEMPEFQQVYEEMGGRVQFLMVNATVSGDTVENAKKFIGQNGYTFPVLFDTASEAAIAYNATSLPMTIFIGADGAVVTHAVGALSEESLNSGIDLIRETLNK